MKFGKRNGTYKIVFFKNLFLKFYNLNSVLFCHSLGHTWYLSPDFQLFMLAPLLVYPLWRFGNKVFVALPLLSLASVTFIFFASYKFEFTVIPIFKWVKLYLNGNTLKLCHSSTPEAYKRFYSYIYEPFYSRICPYLCGMMTAYLIHTNQAFPMKLSKYLNTSLWLSAISITVAIFVGIFPFHTNNNVKSNFMNAFFIAGTQLGWSISVAWIILACHSGAGGVVNSFLSLRIWKPLARIGLSIYLTHILAILAVFGTQKQPAYFNEFLKTHLFLGDLGLSFGVAVLAFLTFEASVLTIERSFHSKKTEKLPPKGHNNEM